jgi:hypothetical protein
MPWGYAAAAVGSALITSNATSKAADKQAQGTSDALAENRREFDITQANQAPYLAAGKNALAQFATENDTPFDPSQVQLDPGYQFGLKQGQQAIDRQAAAAGGRISGAALKSAAQYGTDYATTGYSAAYGRAKQTRDDRLNRLAALAGIGQTATQNVGAQGASTARTNSLLMAAGSDSAAAATMAQGNIWGNATNQLAALYGRPRNNGFTPNTDGIGANPYAGYDAAAEGGWGIE